MVQFTPSSPLNYSGSTSSSQRPTPPNRKLPVPPPINPSTSQKNIKSAQPLSTGIKPNPYTAFSKPVAENLSINSAFKSVEMAYENLEKAARDVEKKDGKPGFEAAYHIMNQRSDELSQALTEAISKVNAMDPKTSPLDHRQFKTHLLQIKSFVQNRFYSEANTHLLLRLTFDLSLAAIHSEKRHSHLNLKDNVYNDLKTIRKAAETHLKKDDEVFATFGFLLKMLPKSRSSQFIPELWSTTKKWGPEEIKQYNKLRESFVKSDARILDYAFFLRTCALGLIKMDSKESDKLLAETIYDNKYKDEVDRALGMYTAFNLYDLMFLTRNVTRLSSIKENASHLAAKTPDDTYLKKILNSMHKNLSDSYER